MVDSLIISKPPSKSALLKGSLLIYLILGLVINGGIWAAALFYLKVKEPSYTSEIVISLPGSESSSSVNIPGIGQAYSQNPSAYTNTTAKDPRENYKFLVQSGSVLKAAANQLNMKAVDFGKPKIKVVDSTTIMRIEIEGDSPEEAQKKSLALYEALEAKLAQLRKQEVDQQDVVLQASLASAEKKLKEAQKNLSNYKAGSGLSSNEQISALTNNIEQLRRQRAEVLAQQQQANGRLRQLSNNLNLSAQQASDAFILQTDPLFQKSLQDYSESSAALVALNAKFLPNHPAIIDETAKRDAAQAALINRARSVLGRPISLTSIGELNLSNTQSSASARTSLSQDLVTAQSQQQGFEAQAKALDIQIAQLEARLKVLAQEETILDAYKRDMQIAETVFSSTLTRLDLSKSNIFASYPQLQILSEPTLPQNPSSPKKLYVLLGAALGSIFCTNGLVLLWLRQRKTSIPKRLEEPARPAASPLNPASMPQMLTVGKPYQNSNHKGVDIGRE